MKKYTYSAKPADKAEKWWLVDANGAVLGRLASVIARRLRGKDNPLFTPHAVTGDSVVVVNADKIVLTGRKWKQKCYYRHSGYMGGLTTTTAEEMLTKKPEDIIRFAVRGMLPKNRLGRKLMKRLRIYTGEDHPHEAQQPEKWEPKAKRVYLNK